MSYFKTNKKVLPITRNPLPVTKALLDGVLQAARGGDGDELVPHQPRHGLPAREQELR